MQRNLFKALPGFSLTEAMVSMSLVAVIAVLTIPSIYNGGATNKGVMLVKNMASSLQVACQKNNESLQAGAASVSMMTFTKAVSQTATGDLLTSTTLDCSTTCHRFTDGGVVVDRGGLAGNSDIQIFHYDPDGKQSGSADLAGVNFYVDTNVCRVTTEGAFTGNANADPDYAQAWTKL